MVKTATERLEKATTKKTKKSAREALQKAESVLVKAKVPETVRDILKSAGLKARKVGGKKPKGFEGTRTVFEDL